MPKDIGVLILAGGVGKRFGDYKPLYELDGKSILENLLDKIPGFDTYISIRYEWQEGEIRRHIKNDKIQFIYDEPNCKYGPICGIVKASQELEYRYILLLSSDMIFIDNPIKLILDTYKSSMAAILISRGNFLEPVPAIYGLEDIKPLTRYVMNRVKEFRLTDLIRASSKANIIQFSMHDFPILNINFQEDLYKLRGHSLKQVEFRYTLSVKHFPRDVYMNFLESLDKHSYSEACELLRIEFREYENLKYENMLNHLRNDLESICRID